MIDKRRGGEREEGCRGQRGRQRCRIGTENVVTCDDLLLGCCLPQRNFYGHDAALAASLLLVPHVCLAVLAFAWVRESQGGINGVVRICCWFPCPLGSTHCNIAATGAHAFWLGTATQDLLDPGVFGRGRRTDDDDTDAWADPVLNKNAVRPILGFEPHLRGSEVCSCSTQLKTNST